MIFVKGIFAVVASLFVTLAYGLPSMTNAEFSVKSEKHSLIIEFSSKAKYRVFPLIDPDRLIIDLRNIDKRSVQKVFSGKSLISGVSRFRIGTPFPDTTRLVLDLNKSIADLNVNEQAANNGNEQIVVQWEMLASKVATDKPDVQVGDTTAMSEYLRAAAQGNASAMYMIGSMYAKGQGVPQDYPQAALWYRKAAEQGDIQAEFSMGVIYDIGQGVAQDYQQAMFWYGKAAEHGNVKAQNNLGFMYSQGKGVEQSYVTSHMWFNIAGVRGYEEGRKNRDFVEKLMAPAQIAAAQKQAGEWMTAHPGG